MDLKKIFIKDACPTKVGGQAVLEGVMMKGESRTAVALRLPDDSIRLKIEPNKAPSKWTKIPLVRGFDDVFLAPHSRHTEVRARKAVFTAGSKRSSGRRRPGTWP